MEFTIRGSTRGVTFYNCVLARVDGARDFKIKPLKKHDVLGFDVISPIINFLSKAHFQDSCDDQC